MCVRVCVSVTEREREEEREPEVAGHTHTHTHTHTQTDAASKDKAAQHLQTELDDVRKNLEDAESRASAAAQQVEAMAAGNKSLEEAQGKLQRELADAAKRLGAAEQALEGKGSEAAAAHKEMTQLQSALAEEKSAKDAAATKSEELEKSLSAEKATRAAADGRVAALERDVAAVQSELEEARKAAADTRANLGGQSAQLSEALEKAKAETRTLIHQRDSLSDEVDGLKKKNTLLEGQVLKTKGEPWAEQKLVFVNTIRMLLQQRINYLKKPEKFSDEKTKQDKIALLAEQIRDNDKAIEPERKELKLWIDAQVAKSVHDREANLLQIIHELKNHNGVRSPEENSHEESTSSRRSGGPGSAHRTDSSEEEWIISDEEHSGRSGGPGSAHGTDSAEDDPEEEYKVQKLEEANQKSGSRSWWDSEESEGSEEDSKRYIILHPDDEQLYINNVLRSATSFKETLIKNPVLENALETLKLSHSLTALQQHLQNVESLRDDLYHENGLQLNAANKIRKECWNFKLQCEKQLEKFEREQNNAQTQEAIKIVRAFIETWNVQDKNWDDSLTEQSLSDGDNVDSSSQAPDDKLRTLKLTLAKHKQARQDSCMLNFPVDSSFSPTK